MPVVRLAPWQDWVQPAKDACGSFPRRTVPKIVDGGNEKTATQILADSVECGQKDHRIYLNDLVVASCTFSNTCCVARVERSKSSFVYLVAWVAICWRYSLWNFAISGSDFAVANE
jgi:hypothetical protein